MEPLGVGGADLRRRLQASLTDALRRRDRLTVGVLRTTLAALDGAGAVGAAPDEGPALAAPSGIAGGVVGVGAAEVPRRELSAEDVERIVRAELREREEAAEAYTTAGQDLAAERVRAEAEVLRALLAG